MSSKPQPGFSDDAAISGVTTRSGAPDSNPWPLRTDSVEPGEVIANKYVVERVIGVGGVAVVVAARHLELEETVAIKILQPELQDRKEIVQRFAREAKAAVRIKSEYAARIFDVGVAPGRGPFLVMEYLDGHDLADRLASGPVPIKKAVEIIMQACEALAVAHANGIVHRDIKPENLFLARSSDGSEIVKVLDFGISKAALTGTLPGLEIDVVKTQELMGTPLYMSPEQIRSTATVDRRADIWSLGAVLYELVTGHQAFAGDLITKICADVLERDPLPLKMFVDDLPEGFQEVVSRCLEKDPGRRFQNVAELAVALLPFGPSTARILAERSSTILRVAGHGGAEVTLKFSSAPPPPPGMTPSGSPIPTALRAPVVPTLSNATPPPEAPAGSEAHLTNPEALREIATESRRTRRVIVFASVLLFAIVAGGVLFTSYRSTAPVHAEVTTRAVLIETDPPGVRVEVDGKLLGETPLRATLGLGEKKATLSRDGYRPETLSLTIDSSDPEERKVQLTMSKTAPAASAEVAATAHEPPLTATTTTVAPAPAAPPAAARSHALPAWRPATPPPATHPAPPPIAKTASAAAPIAAPVATMAPSTKTVSDPAPTTHVKVIGEKKTNVTIVE